MERFGRRRRRKRSVVAGGGKGSRRPKKWDAHCHGTVAHERHVIHHVLLPELEKLELISALMRLMYRARIPRHVICTCNSSLPRDICASRGVHREHLRGMLA